MYKLELNLEEDEIKLLLENHIEVVRNSDVTARLISKIIDAVLKTDWPINHPHELYDSADEAYKKIMSQFS
jgi:hypothetical protein